MQSPEDLPKSPWPRRAHQMQRGVEVPGKTMPNQRSGRPLLSSPAQHFEPSTSNKRRPGSGSTTAKTYFRCQEHVRNGCDISQLTVSKGNMTYVRGAFVLRSSVASRSRCAAVGLSCGPCNGWLKRRGIIRDPQPRKHGVEALGAILCVGTFPAPRRDCVDEPEQSP